MRGEERMRFRLPLAEFPFDSNCPIVLWIICGIGFLCLHHVGRSRLVNCYMRVFCMYHDFFSRFLILLHAYFVCNHDFHSGYQ